MESTEPPHPTPPPPLPHMKFSRLLQDYVQLCPVIYKCLVQMSANVKTAGLALLEEAVNCKLNDFVYL